MFRSNLATSATNFKLFLIRGFDKETYERFIKEEAYEEGIEQGTKKGMQQGKQEILRYLRTLSPEELKGVLEKDNEEILELVNENNMNY